MENDNEAHSAPVKIEALDEALSESQAAPPSSQLAVHFLAPESGCGNLDLPPSPPPLPLVSESVVPEIQEELSMEMAPPVYQITNEPPLKKRRNMHQKLDQSIEACKIEVETVPLVSGTAEIDTHGEEQMEAQQMDLNYREDEVSDRSPAEMAPQESIPRNLETHASSGSDTIVSTGQRETTTQDTPSGAGDTAAASAQGDVCHIQGPRRQGQTNVKNKRPNSEVLSRRIHQKRDVSSSSRDTHDDPIPTPYEMSQYVDRALAFVPGIQSRTDRVSDFLWYPNAEHSILEAATGGLDATTVRHNRMSLKYQTTYGGTLRAMGLYQLSQMTEEIHDEGLSSGLIERWRPETHTFHLPHAEMTVTLHDVSCLWGMTIIGVPVTGVEYGDFRHLCIELLGYSHVELQKEKKKGEKIQISPSTISLAKLRAKFKEYPDCPDQSTIDRYMRAYILEMITCRLFPDSHGDQVRLCYLELLHDLPTAGRYNWGGATLACLYRGLDNACLKKKKTFIGPCMLLQHWSYAHLIVGRPVLANKVDVPKWGKPEPDNCPAYGAKYCFPKIWIGSGHGASLGITFWRHEIEHLRDDPEYVTWEPYKEYIEVDGVYRCLMELLPERCRQQERFWRAEVPLICFQFIEHHYPGRVMRQFGMRQQSPPPAPISEELWQQLHPPRDTTAGKNWAIVHADYVAQAGSANPPIAEQDRPMDVASIPYRDWYQNNGAYTIYLEGCIADNPHERVPRPRDRRGRIHGIVPAGAPFASTALYLVKSCVIAIMMTTMRGWKRLGKAILKHNVPAVCQCGYRSRLDSLLRCAGLGGCDAIDDISDEPDIYIPYAGDETLFAVVQNAETVGQAFDRGVEALSGSVSWSN